MASYVLTIGIFTCCSVIMSMVTEMILTFRSTSGNTRPTKHFSRFQKRQNDLGRAACHDVMQTHQNGVRSRINPSDGSAWSAGTGASII